MQESSTMKSGIDGTWTLAFNTPGGERSATLTVRAKGDGSVVGTYDGDPISDGRFDGSTLAFSAQLSSPFKLKIKCTATLNGSTLTGRGRAAMMNIAFRGTRTA